MYESKIYERNTLRNIVNYRKLLTKKLHSYAVFFALFLTAGHYKGSSVLYFLQSHIDITLLLEVLTIMIVILEILRKHPKYVLSKAFIWLKIAFVALSVWIFLGLIYTPNQIYSVEKAGRFILITGWAFWGAILITKNFKSLYSFLLTIFAVSTIIAIIALLKYFSMYRTDIFYSINILYKEEKWK